MHSASIQNNYRSQQQTQAIPTTPPTTPRGRALFTVDWFLNGKPVLRNHDHPCQTLRNGFCC